MIDQEYFRTHLPGQVRQLGANPVVRVILVSGIEYVVRGIDHVEAGYVMLNVYPHDSAATFHSPSHYDVAKTESHPITVAYEEIAQLHFSNSTQEDRPKVGFFG
jgi:hypothetical protein